MSSHSQYEPRPSLILDSPGPQVGVPNKSATRTTMPRPTTAIAVFDLSGSFSPDIFTPSERYSSKLGVSRLFESTAKQKLKQKINLALSFRACFYALFSQPTREWSCYKGPKRKDRDEKKKEGYKLLRSITQAGSLATKSLILGVKERNSKERNPSFRTSRLQVFPQGSRSS